MPKILTYIQQFDNKIEEIKRQIAETGIKPTLLLHVCCAPCSSFVLENLAEYFDVTIYYYNPNIHPKSEYMQRRNELKEFVQHFPPAMNVKIIIPEYEPREFFNAIDLEHHPERRKEREKGERCQSCYHLRIAESYKFAIKNNFDYMTTALSISPYKDAKIINTIGQELEDFYPTHTKFLIADFKKKNGFKRSLEISCEYKLYRQDYCGCVFSKHNG